MHMWNDLQMFIYGKRMLMESIKKFITTTKKILHHGQP